MGVGERLFQPGFDITIGKPIGEREEDSPSQDQDRAKKNCGQERDFASYVPDSQIVKGPFVQLLVHSSFFSYRWFGRIARGAVQTLKKRKRNILICKLRQT